SAAGPSVRKGRAEASGHDRLALGEIRRHPMLALFFIDRPVLAWVISLIIVLLGGIAAALLPIAEYPEISPPTVRVTANYPGANARVVADTVAAPIEQQVNGVE